MKKYILIVAVFFSIGISGCKKDYLSLEVNPNQPSVSPPGLTLAGALVTAAATVNGGSYAEYGVWAGFFTRSGNYVPSTTLDQFQLTNTSYTGVWTTLYSNLTNFNNLQVAAAKDPTLANYQAIAMIMKVYDFQQLVDQFGDVPYSQAFQPSTILNPGYDNQLAIYNDLVKQLDAAIALIKNSSTAANPGAADVVFGGNMIGWRKFANTLKLRLAVRQSNLATNAAATDLDATAGEGYLDGTTQAIANPGYSNTLSGSSSQQSPFYASYGFDVNGNATGNNLYYRANVFFIKILQADNDPRLNRVFTPTTAGNIIDGNVFGDVATAKSNPNTSAFGPGLLKSPTMGAVLMSGAESLFLQSEALVRGYAVTKGTGILTAQTAYEAGITASFAAMGLTSAQATTYYTQAIQNVGWAASVDKIQAIIYQKYISLAGYGNLEAYLEYERTGFPVLPNPVSIDPSAVSAIIPKRQYYPQSELNSNATNLGKVGTINIFTTKIFWEK
jgi:hypothetical protein